MARFPVMGDRAILLCMKTFDTRFKEVMKDYEQAYDLSTLNNANDKANLETLIRNAVLIEILQQQVNELAQKNATANIAEIKKLSDAAKDLIDRNMQLEKQLGIDRKSRKKDNESTTGEYLLLLKEAAKQFVDRRLIKVYCPDCQVMVGRISPVHEHTAFSAAFQCSQCKKMVSATRQEKDVFFDLHKDDKEWRRKYPVEIKHPKKKKRSQSKVDDEPEAEAELIIEDDFENDTQDA